MELIQHGSVVAEKYEILRLLASGSMGDVFVAKHLITSKEVALKVLYPNVAQAIGGVERFLREVRAASAINHPGVVQIFDAGEEDGVLYYTMELLKGQSLANWLMSGEHSLELSLWLVREVLEPLAIAHEQGIVHRDIKPENIFVIEDAEGLPTVKLLDFGIAYEQTGNRMTQTGYTLGTPLYMSPEQAMAPKTVNPASDVWSIGVILYEAITGQVPFDAETPQAICILSITEPHTPVSERVEGVPDGLERLVDRCLSKEPEARPADARALLQELDAVLTTEDILMTGEDIRLAAAAMRGSVPEGQLEVWSRPATDRLTPLPAGGDGVPSRSALQQALAATLSGSFVAPVSSRNAMKARASARSAQLSRVNGAVNAHNADASPSASLTPAPGASQSSSAHDSLQNEAHEHATQHLMALVKPSAAERLTTLALVVVLLFIVSLVTYQVFSGGEGGAPPVEPVASSNEGASAPAEPRPAANESPLVAGAGDVALGTSGASAREARRRNVTRREAQANLYAALDVAAMARPAPAQARRAEAKLDKRPASSRLDRPRLPAIAVEARSSKPSSGVQPAEATPQAVVEPIVRDSPAEDAPTPSGDEDVVAGGEPPEAPGGAEAQPVPEEAVVAAPATTEEESDERDEPQPETSDSPASGEPGGAAEPVAAPNAGAVAGAEAPAEPSSPDVRPKAESDAQVDSNREEEAPAPPITF